MSEQRRYHLIDAIRAAAVINMILYHLCYDIFCVFGVWKDFYLSLPVVLWERAISFTFITVSGISMNLSRRPVKRGIVVLLCGVLISVITILLMPEQSIRFGVLSFLGCAMLLTRALKKPLDRMPPLFGMLLFLLLFMLSFGIPYRYLGLFSCPLVTLPDALYQVPWLAFLGFIPDGFFSADFFPILPWIFLYLFGYQLWRFLAEKGLDRIFYRRVPVLEPVGRHSLIIYMAHQPLLYGACWIVFTYLL